MDNILATSIVAVYSAHKRLRLWAAYREPL